MRVSRRTFLSTTGAAGVGAALTAGASLGNEDVAEAANAVAFHGAHQAGIVTPPQAHLVFAAFDVVADRDGLVALLKSWTRVAERLTQGLPVDDGLDFGGQPLDTGEARDLDPSRLTVTLGFGRSLFDERFGLQNKLPEPLITLPRTPGDVLDPASSDGDLGVQICADSPQVAFHAFRNLTRVAKPLATLRWSQTGFQGGPGSGSSKPRNLQGFKDGTNNLKTTDASLMDEHVWVAAADGPAWMQGGTYLATRRIRMLIEAWDRESLTAQERIVGRSKVANVPLGSKKETDRLNIYEKDARNEYVLPLSAHVRLASPESNNGARMLRRSYSYSDGVDPNNGLIDAGLFFISYQRDLRKQFVLIQRRLFGDALANFIRHTSSAAFAVPPGVSKDGWLGQALLT